MFLLSFFQWISAWAPIIFIRDSKYGMPAVQSVHLMGLTILLATMLTVDLRLAGIGMKGFTLPSITQQLKPWTACALALVILSGSLIFLATPGKYLGSNPFRVKMALLCLAILFHLSVLRRFVRSEPGSHSRMANVLVAGLSLTLWFSVGWAGRAIAFVP